MKVNFFEDGTICVPYNQSLGYIDALENIGGVSDRNYGGYIFQLKDEEKIYNFIIKVNNGEIKKLPRIKVLCNWTTSEQLVKDINKMNNGSFELVR